MNARPAITLRLEQRPARDSADAAAPRRIGSAAVWSASVLAHVAVLALIVNRLGAKPAHEPPVAPPIAIEIAAPSQPARTIARPVEPAHREAPPAAAQPHAQKAAPPSPRAPATHEIEAPAAATPINKPAPPSQEAASAQRAKAAVAPAAAASATVADAPAPEPIVTPPIGNAAYLHNPPPHYPPSAQEEGWEGRVVLRVHVDANGRPISVELHQSSGHDVLDKAALAATRQWTFVPAKRGATPIDGWVDVPLEFHLN
jgi:protein TonB